MKFAGVMQSRWPGPPGAGAEVVGEAEIAQPAPAIPDFGRHPRDDLVLHGDADLPIVRTCTRAAEEAGVRGRGVEPAAEDGDPPGRGLTLIDRRIPGRDRARRRAKRLGADRALQRPVREVAVHGPVGVAVDPVARVLVGERRHRRVVLRPDAGQFRRLDVLAHVEFQRGLAGAEEIEGRAHPRRDVLESPHALAGRKHNLRGLQVDRDVARAVDLFGMAARRVVEPRRPLQRQAAEGPIDPRRRTRGSAPSLSPDQAC